MKIEDQRLLYRTWRNSRRIHKLDFVDWLNLIGYTIESRLVGEDEKRQKEWLEILKI